MKRLPKIISVFGLLAAPCYADLVLYNTTSQKMTYELVLPNGDVSRNEINPNTGYGPAQTMIRLDAAPSIRFSVKDEGGKSLGDIKCADNRVFLISDSGGTAKLTKISWYRDNGQAHKRLVQIFNATSEAVNFDLIDSKQVRKDIVLQPGELKQLDAMNGFSGSSGFHHIRFKDSSGAEVNRMDSQVQASYFHIIYKDKRNSSPKDITVGTYGWLTPPKGVKE
jgi:hypothetical protein